MPSLFFSARTSTLLLGAIVSWTATGCGSEEPLFTTGSGGDTSITTSTTGGGGTGGSGGTTSTTGSGGTGATFTSCEACTPEAPICVDEMACAAACPEDRDLCHPGGAPAAGLCCAAGEQCCEATVFDYPNGDLCRPGGEACPLPCPEGDSACAPNAYCELDGPSGTYKCSETCAPERICGANLCCPFGTLCEDGTCKLPDLAIDAEQMLSSIKIEIVDFAPDSCEIFEGCVAAPGKRTLMRFDLRTPNIGVGNLHLGDPEGNDFFAYSQCHDHFHFESYADYRLLDKDGNDVAFGHKQAFCLEDTNPNTNPPPGPPNYSCTFQGITAGWSDVYNRGLACQWVDITDVPPGDYTLRASVNGEKILMESSFDNNVAEIPVVVPPNSCPNGCLPVDATCCKAGDPCGWASNGSCDCADSFGWDGVDCASCVPSDDFCLIQSSCTAGCSPNTGPCCAEGDPCGLADNNACDCEAAFTWDDTDCGTCNNPNPPCPPNTCPNGCTPPDINQPCCQEGNPCGWNNDGFCDCGGLLAFDAQDCGHCTDPGPNCP